MPLDSDSVLLALQSWQQALGKPARVYVALSGGRDSSVLLALLAKLSDRLDAQLIAVHVNHRLQPEADRWQEHCAELARRFDVPFRAIEIDVVAQGAGREGDARLARYAALTELLQDGDWLLTGHHEDDQAETLLLNLMRGSGVDGLRGIAESRPLGRGILLRPLLSCSTSDLDEYGRNERLDWIDDPTNEDTSFDRNFLRARVLPLLAERWPNVRRQLAQSATLAADAAQLNAELAATDLAVSGTARQLSIAALQALSPARQANLLRHACAVAGLAPPPRRQLAAILQDVLPAREDGSPSVAWQDVTVRRYREHLYLLDPGTGEPSEIHDLLRPVDRVSLGAGLGTLQLQAASQGGISPRAADAGLAVRFRQGGEALRPAGRGMRKSLKSLLQEAGILPWMRDRLPLLYHGDALVAVADLWIAQDYFAADGYRVVWENQPAVLAQRSAPGE